MRMRVAAPVLCVLAMVLAGCGESRTDSATTVPPPTETGASTTVPEAVSTTVAATVAPTTVAPTTAAPATATPTTAVPTTAAPVPRTVSVFITILPQTADTAYCGDDLPATIVAKDAGGTIVATASIPVQPNTFNCAYRGTITLPPSDFYTFEHGTGAVLGTVAATDLEDGVLTIAMSSIGIFTLS
jgi:hypothetical protein